MDNFVPPNANTYCQNTVSIDQQPGQAIWTEEINHTCSTYGSIFLLLLFISYIFGRWHGKQREQQRVTRFQQIQTLERIWKMSAEREP